MASPEPARLDLKPPDPPIPLSEVRAKIVAMEKELDAGATLEPERLHALEPSVVHWGVQSAECHPIPRFARLLARIKDHSTALEILKLALTSAPDNQTVPLLLANMYAELGEHDTALDILRPVAERPDAEPAVIKRAADFHWKLGNTAESLALQRRAGAVDPSRMRFHLNSLLAAGRSEDALREGRQVLADDVADAGLLFAALNALRRHSGDADEIARARARFLAAAEADSTGPFWRARLHRTEQNLDAALAELDQAVLGGSADAALLRERASVAIALGHWGRDARALRDAQEAARDFPELRAQLDSADGLLRAFGATLQDAAQNPARFDHVRSPESVFELVAKDTARPRIRPNGNGLAMIAHSLTAGGAERIVANTYRHLREGGRFDWVALYLFNLSPQDGSDFYLPLTGLSPQEAVVLDRGSNTEPPFSYLPFEPGRKAQAIYNRLLQDRPAVVHASLEPLTLHAGLAALAAGIPKIVLHTHNMRPTELHPDSPAPPRWRDCYRALLGREEVRLLGCAEASIRDYADWIGLTDTSNLGVVYNGLDFDKFRPAPAPETGAELRESLGIPAGAPTIGTAFKFREEKRPLLWAEAACRVLALRPDSRFVMFGDGPLLRPTMAYVAASGARASFSFPGLVPDLYRWLPMLDLFMLSSKSEALPNVLLEAQASGVPVIAHNVGGIAETMIDGTTGLLVREDSADALAGAILRAIDAPEWRKRAASEGPAFVRERFNTEKMIETLTGYMLGR